jgi:hypothetical protein
MTGVIPLLFIEVESLPAGVCIMFVFVAGVAGAQAARVKARTTDKNTNFFITGYLSIG